MADVFGLIGHPVAHSYSPAIFRKIFLKDCSQRSYRLFDIESLDAQSLGEIINNVTELKGFNVTSPYKTAIIPYLAGLSDTAQAVGAVNTVWIDRSCHTPALYGHNTDVDGIVATLENVGMIPKHKGCLILGTGGASMAAEYAVEKLGMECLKVSRSSSGVRNIITYEDIRPELLKYYSLIINATPAGMHPLEDMMPPFPADLLTENNFIFDMIYNPSQTQFMKEGAKYGCKSVGGLEMLKTQALAALDFWEKHQYEGMQ